MRGRFGVQWIAPAEQHAQSVFHERLAAPGCQRQDLQVFLSAALRSMFFPQCIVGEPEPARRKQIFPISIVLKRARLANQPINNVAVIDAMFTTATQIDHLLQIARERGLEDFVLESLSRTVVSSIGPTTTEALEEFGIRPDLEPSHPKMGFLVIETAAHAEQLLRAKRPTSAGQT